MNIWNLLFKTINLIFRIKNKIYSHYYKRVLSSKDIYIQVPCRIIGSEYITVIGGFSSLSGLRIECIDKYNNDEFSPKLKIGNKVSFNSNCHIGCINEIEIGDNVLVGSNVLITDHSHGSPNDEPSLPPSKRPLWSKGKVMIGANCWIGENVCILPNVRVGNNCIIGAGSVITKDIPPFSVIAGNPQRIIKTLKNNSEFVYNISERDI